MTELYNTTGFNNATSLLDVMTGINSAIGSDFLLGNLILLSFALVFLVFGYRHGWLEVLLLDGFVTTLLAILFAYTGLISFVTIVFPATLFFIVLVFYLIYQ
jgi:hypothetical protein